ncbi:2'-5' RNA ligase family protein [Marinobacter salexigens]|uniref:2'-5' RNA ligase family protein n=1 Tax=Marinobacter salexigens TaxID=1925763 RepID=UPI000C28658E|nr:2'-5' RNA ligase family protein [Marinobacter salexigens]
MFSDFLNHKTTYETELRDFPEWHEGIEHFGFWAIEISDADCLKKIRSHQEHLSDKLHSGYLRQPHITLALEGLMEDGARLGPSIMKTVKRLEACNLQVFPLWLGGCNSFPTCPYLQVIDPKNNLSDIRRCLNSAPHAGDPKIYTPHVTLGFYNKAYDTIRISEHISEIQSPDIEFTVDEIVFAQYKTNEVQGPYRVLHRIRLGGL